MRPISIQQSRSSRRGARGRDTWARFGLAAVAAVCALGVGASGARPARSDQVTINMIANSLAQPGWSALMSNFERVYPNIAVNITYGATTTILNQLETTELAAGSAPDLLSTSPGCGQTVSICVLAKAGYLAPLVREPWVTRSLRLVTSFDKYGAGLFAFEPQLAPYGVFTNDGLFKRLGLSVPQTFSQLLEVCQKSKAAGTVALIWDGASGAGVSLLIDDLAVATVYGQDKHWAGELRAGRVTFDGTPGWHQALDEVVEMNDAGCFQPGVTASSPASAIAEFDQGQGLMLPALTTDKGTIDAGDPQFDYSADPFPGGTAPNETRTLLQLSASVSVNAHSSVQNQAAARTFVDFIARPKQNALFTQIQGGLTQDEFLKGQIPTFMSSFAPVLNGREYVINPGQTWWNANVLLTLQQNGIGLITGQRTVDSVLSAMDVAWQQGPS
jgi:raffinose/stachyose/melibiose transport system substrate-binding protein